MSLLKNFAAMYDDDIRTRILDGIGEVPNVYQQYFEFRETDKYIESSTGYSGLGAMVEWDDGEPIPLDAPALIYNNTVTQEFYGMGFKASRQLIKYGDISTIMKWAASLGRSLGQTYGTVHADVLNNSFTTTWSALGSVALISASHGSMGSVTRSNINASAALTPATLEVLIAQGSNLQTYRGLRDPVKYDKLITVPALRRQAAKILDSDGEMGTGNNDTNTQRGMFSLVIDPFLEDSTTHYFLQGPGHGLESIQRQMPRRREYMDEPTESRVFTLSADFQVNVEQWEGMAGSQGA